MGWWQAQVGSHFWCTSLEPGMLVFLHSLHFCAVLMSCGFFSVYAFGKLSLHRLAKGGPVRTDSLAVYVSWNNRLQVEPARYFTCLPVFLCGCHWSLGRAGNFGKKKREKRGKKGSFRYEYGSTKILPTFFFLLSLLTFLIMFHCSFYLIFKKSVYILL
jgi:hypothetical protein